MQEHVFLGWCLFAVFLKAVSRPKRAPLSQRVPARGFPEKSLKDEFLEGAFNSVFCWLSESKKGAFLFPAGSGNKTLDKARHGRCIFEHFERTLDTLTLVGTS